MAEMTKKRLDVIESYAKIEGGVVTNEAVLDMIAEIRRLRPEFQPYVEKFPGVRVYRSKSNHIAVFPVGLLWGNNARSWEKIQSEEILWLTPYDHLLTPQERDAFLDAHPIPACGKPIAHCEKPLGHSKKKVEFKFDDRSLVSLEQLKNQGVDMPPVASPLRVADLVDGEFEFLGDDGLWQMRYVRHGEVFFDLSRSSIGVVTHGCYADPAHVRNIRKTTQ